MGVKKGKLTLYLQLPGGLSEARLEEAKLQISSEARASHGESLLGNETNRGSRTKICWGRG